ncbi:hypothetical protein [Nocardia aurantia]|uniref:Uncharacterized protein n=1 Tax=Nocardia aurantia TaxID=2585199 RepID=A0A7K0DS42_9NOCA|nr:hypothetical protein [Nocardia aurantia]MQY28418.1 hypothetical protein [Nocardia aurantia]
MLTHRDGARLLTTCPVPETGAKSGPAQQGWENILPQSPAQRAWRHDRSGAGLDLIIAGVETRLRAAG